MKYDWWDRGGILVYEKMIYVVVGEVDILLRFLFSLYKIIKYNKKNGIRCKLLLVWGVI